METPNYERFDKPDLARAISSWYVRLADLMGKPEMQSKVSRLVDDLYPDQTEGMHASILQSYLSMWFNDRRFSHYNDPTEAEEVYSVSMKLIREPFSGIEQEHIDIIVAQNSDPLSLQKDLGRKVDALNAPVKKYLLGHSGPKNDTSPSFENAVRVLEG